MHVHTHSHSHIHIYCNLLLIEKPFAFSKLLQGTLQKPKGKKNEVRTKIAAYSGSKKAGVVWEFVVFVSAAACLLLEDFEGFFPWV